MKTIERARPWIVAIGHGVLLAGIVSTQAINGLGWFIASLVLWIALLVFTTTAPAERGGFYVRHGALLWIGAAIVAVPAGLVLTLWPAESDVYGVGTFLAGAAILHSVLLSAIHLARFHVPRVRQQGRSQEMVIRRRRGGRLALTLRILGMLMLAAAVVDLLWMPLIMMTDVTDYFYGALAAAAGLSLIGAGLLYLSRFAADLGRGKMKVVVEP